MSQSTQKRESREPAPSATTEPRKPAEKPRWETPRMEDVSEEVIAQPYIRFT